MRNVTLLLVVAFALVLAPSQTHAATLSEMVARMDQIIKEMQSLQAEFAQLSSQVGNSATPPGAVLGESTKKRLTKTPLFGETSDEIGLIQKLLKTDPEVYPYGVVSGFFGPKTEEAIKNLQSKFGMNPVGVVGPATTELLEAFFAKYPNDEFPSNALASDPRTASPIVAGDATSKPTAPSTPAVNTGNIDKIHASMYEGGAEVAIFFKNDNVKEFDVDGDSKAEIIAAIASKSGLTAAVVTSTIQFVKAIDLDASDEDEEEAEDALDEAEEALEDAELEIEEADADGEDVDWAEDTLDEAYEALEEAEEAFDDEDWDEAIELAEEAMDLADDAVDRIDEEEDDDGGGESDDIDRILAKVSEDSTRIIVEYEDSDQPDEKFTVTEDDEDDIIAAVADELDLGEDDVEDLIEFDYGAIDSINVEVYEADGEAEVEVEFTSGHTKEFTIDAGDEDDMIEEIAKELDADEDEVEDAIDFDYN